MIFNFKSDYNVMVIVRFGNTIKVEIFQGLAGTCSSREI